MHTFNGTPKKRFLIVSGPVCSGKTTLAVNIARNAGNVFYFDKDDIVTTSKATFRAAYENANEAARAEYGKQMETFDRHGTFFKKYIRNPEYVTTRDAIIKGLQFNNFVIVNSPYTSELKKEAAGNCPAFDEMRTIFDKEECEFFVVFVHVPAPELKRRLLQRMIEDADARERDYMAYGPKLLAEYQNYKADTLPEWVAKLVEATPAGSELGEYINKYVANENTTAPDFTLGKNVDELFVFEVETDEMRDASYAKLMKRLGIENYKPYDRKYPVNKLDANPDWAK